MKTLFNTIMFVFVILVFALPKVFGQQASSIEMLAGLSKPPFIIANQDKGMQLDIIAAALAKSEQFVHFTYLPMNRHLDVFHSRGFDGIVTLSEHEKEWGICLSKPYIIYQNVVVTLAKPEFDITDIEDLAGLKVAAFQNATHFLGDKYEAMFKDSANYVELADQSSQINLLFSGRVDALVMDINIFKHLLATKRTENSSHKIYNQKTEIHFLFKPRIYKAGFKSKKLCQQFDQGINAILADGSYQQIIDSYLGQ